LFYELAKKNDNQTEKWNFRIQGKKNPHLRTRVKERVTNGHQKRRVAPKNQTGRKGAPRGDDHGHAQGKKKKKKIKKSTATHKKQNHGKVKSGKHNTTSNKIKNAPRALKQQTGEHTKPKNKHKTRNQ